MHPSRHLIIMRTVVALASWVLIMDVLRARQARYAAWDLGIGGLTTGGGRGGRGEAVIAEAEAAKERRIAIEASMLMVAGLLFGGLFEFEIPRPFKERNCQLVVKNCVPFFFETHNQAAGEPNSTTSLY